MTYLILIPNIWTPYLDACLATLKAPREYIHVVHNEPPNVNIGVTRSWNVGVDRVLAEGIDWLVIMSAAMRFGESGGMDFLAALDDYKGSWAVEAIDGEGPAGSGNIGWHCLAFARDPTLLQVGRVDHVFKSYIEGIDLGYRIIIASGWQPSDGQVWPKVLVDCRCESIGHGTQLGGAIVPPGPLLNDLYQAKWGNPKGRELWTHPYGRDELPITWTGFPPDPPMTPGEDKIVMYNGYQPTTVTAVDGTPFVFNCGDIHTVPDRLVRPFVGHPDFEVMDKPPPAAGPS